MASNYSLVAAVGGLLCVGAAGFALAMLRAAARGTSAGPRLRTLAMGVGVLLGGLAGTASGLSAWLAPNARLSDVPLAAEVPLVTIFLVALTFLPAVLRPHQRRDALARLRVGLDTIGAVACLLFLPWLLLFSAGDRPGASLTALIFGGGAAAVVLVAGVHAVRHRAALRWCGPGAALFLVGLIAIVVGMDHPGQENAAIAVFAAALAVDAAAAMIWYSTVRLHPDGGPLPPVGSEPAAGFPLFAAPVLGSALVTGYHLLNGRRMDAVSITLATVAITAIAARESTAAIALRRHANHLTDQGNRLRNLVFGSSDVAMVLDADLAVRWQSPAAARHFGLSDQDVLGRPASALVDPGQADELHAFLSVRLGGPTGEASSIGVRLRDGFGRWRATEWTANGEDPAEPGRTLVVHVRDVSGLGDLRDALSQAALVDHQTSLANRRGLRRAADPMPDTGALIVLELGGLTAISDLHGAPLSEAVLVEAARRLRDRVEDSDVPARVGEMRFAVLTRGGAVRAHLLASQLITVLTAPYTAAGTIAHLSAWAGIADVTAEATDIDEVLRQAGVALRAVRSGPPGAVEWFEKEMEARLLRRSTLEQDLPGVVTRGELTLSYQPVVELPGGAPAGVEAVVSWRHPALGPVPAGEVLALAEDLGLLGELSSDLLGRAGRDLAGWRRQHESLWLSLRLRPRVLPDPVFQAALETVLEAHRLPESSLVIEIAEEDLQAVGPELDVASELGKLRARGLRTAVGRFGAGPTSLSRLRVLPIDLLKIDREVFGPATEDGIMAATVTLGRRLGMDVVAYGVGTDADLAAVREAGCRLGQGELFGRPMPAERLEALLEHSRTGQ